MHNSKAQTALEFMVTVIFIMFFMLAAYVAVFGRTAEASYSQRYSVMGDACSQVAKSINDVFYFGYGFSQNITVASGNFSIFVANRTVICADREQSVVELLFANRTVNGTGSPSFAVPQGNIKIENALGTVVIST
jgi:hypothetical protein